jgi:hypothetical protein
MGLLSRKWSFVISALDRPKASPSKAEPGDRDPNGVADPRTVKKNILKEIGGQNELYRKVFKASLFREDAEVAKKLLDIIDSSKATAEGYRKVLKVSRFDDTARAEIRTAAEGLVRDLRQYRCDPAEKSADEPETSAETMKAELAGGRRAGRAADHDPGAKQENEKLCKVKKAVAEAKAAELAAKLVKHNLWEGVLAYLTWVEDPAFLIDALQRLLVPNDAPSEGNDLDAEQAAARRKQEFAALDAPVTGVKHGGGGDIRPGRGDAPAAASIPTVSITTGNGTDHPAATAPTDDGLDIPPYLRREPKAV